MQRHRINYCYFHLNFNLKSQTDLAKFAHLQKFHTTNYFYLVGVSYKNYFYGDWINGYSFLTFCSIWWQNLNTFSSLQFFGKRDKSKTSKKHQNIKHHQRFSVFRGIERVASMPDFFSYLKSPRESFQKLWMKY